MIDSRFQFIVVTCTLLVACGCGDPIHDVNTFVPAPTGLTLASRSDESFYEWPMTRDGYIVAKPPQMAYVTSFETKFKVPDPLAADLVPWSTDGIDDDMLEFLEEAYNPNPVALDYKLSLPAPSLRGPHAFDVSSDGTRLVVIDDKGLALYNAETGERIGNMKLPLEIASTKPPVNAVRFGGNTKDMLVASDQKIFRINSKDGSVVSVKGCGEPIAQWIVTRDDKSMLIRSESGRLFGGDPQLEFFTSYNVGKDLTFDVASLSPDGSKIGVVVDNYPRTYIIDKFQIVEQLDHREIRLDPQVSIGMGVSSDVWADGDGMLIKYKNDSNEYKHDAFHMFWKPLQVSVTQPYTESENSCLVVGSRFVDGNEQLIMFDFGPRSRTPSIPCSLKTMPIRFTHDIKGSRIAILDTDGLHLGHRPVWRCRDAGIAINSFFRWIDEGRTSEIERLIAIIAKQDRLGFGKTSQDLIGLIIGTIANRWKYLEQHFPDEAYYKAMQAWLAKGSQLALVCSAVRHNKIAWQARGTGTVDTVTRNGWKVFEERNKLVSEQVRQALELDGDVPLIGFETMIQADLDQDGDLEKVDAFCRQATELYPGETKPHGTISFKLLPQWHGEPGDVISFCLSVSKMTAGAASDLQFAKLVGGIAYYVDYNNVNWVSYDPIKIRRGIKEFVRRGDTETDVMWNLWTQLVIRTKDQPSADILMTDFLEHLAAPPWSYTHGNMSSLMQQIHNDAERIRGR